MVGEEMQRAQKVGELGDTFIGFMRLSPYGTHLKATVRQLLYQYFGVLRCIADATP